MAQCDAFCSRHCLRCGIAPRIAPHCSTIKNTTSMSCASAGKAATLTPIMQREENKKQKRSDSYEKDPLHYQAQGVFLIQTFQSQEGQARPKPTRSNSPPY